MKTQDLYAPLSLRSRLPWGVLAPVIGFGMIVFSILTGTLLLTPFIALDVKENPTSPMGLVAFTLVPFGLLLVTLLTWVWVVERRPFASIGLAGSYKRRSFLAGFLVAIAMAVVVIGVIWFARGFSLVAFGSAWSSPGALASIALLLVGFAVQSSVEEILFRGWLLSVLAKKFNVPIGVLVSSSLFTLLHYERGQPLLVASSTFLFALFCCAWALRSRSVLGVMGWHTGWNWLIAVGFGLPLTGMDVGIPALLVHLKPVGADWLTGGTDGPEGSIVSVALIALCTGALLMRRPRQPTTV
ncbi:MAG: CPBP family intramembrane glutamic endopeptidase [Phycisphaerales bacterium]